MEPLRQGATLQQIQNYVAEMEAERHLDKQDLPSQCLKLGEERHVTGAAVSLPSRSSARERSRLGAVSRCLLRRLYVAVDV